MIISSSLLHSSITALHSLILKCPLWPIQIKLTCCLYLNVLLDPQEQKKNSITHISVIVQHTIQYYREAFWQEGAQAGTHFGKQAQ